MTGAWSFLTRRQGHHNQMTWADWVAYAYLLLGFLIIFLPIVWLGLNSIKSQFQIEKQDLSLMPTDYVRVARATVNGPEGRSIFIMTDLPSWVINWNKLKTDERVGLDPAMFLMERTGGERSEEFYALRTHLGLMDRSARDLITQRNLPDWLNRYSTLTPSAKKDLDVDGVLASLDDEQRRLISEFLGIKPFKPNKLISQILVTAPHPDTGEVAQFSVGSVTGRQKVVTARQVGDPTGKVYRLPKESLTAKSLIRPAWENYSRPLNGTASGVTVNFVTCLTNSLMATVFATIITLLINSMAAFALSKYRFRGQLVFFLIILATLMVPATITLVGVFKIIHATGLSGSIWGVIIPGAATPAGVFLLRQYMLTIPDELIEAARMDAASEWKVYWRIILPLALPALAALGILSIIWRWNDLILPMVAIATTKEAYTIQLCLLEFRGEHLSQEHYRLAMTVLSLIPTTIVFVFLQRYLTTGIANTGMK